MGQDAQTTFTNPILEGDYPDPTIMREGNDFYMTHSAFDYLPGLTVFHSVDLIHWEPISAALTTYLGHAWAADISKYGSKYYIYFTVYPKGNFVVYADSPYGPWSEPVNLNIKGIDPCHVIDETGQRWLFLSGGNRVKLADDGLSVIGKFEQVYKGWQYPKDWKVEGTYLEGPKLKKIGEYYYYISAQGGTAGPATSHMAVVARSKSLAGPWENAPNNPLIHTYSASEKWWSKGHGSLVDLPDGSWWIVYHGYAKDFRGLGRQTLLEPISIGADGWLVAPLEAKMDQPIQAPLPLMQRYDRYDKLPDFRIGREWKYYKKYDSSRASVKRGILTLQAQDSTVHSSAPLLFVAGVKSYEVRFKIQADAGATAGVVLFYNDKAYLGAGFDSKMIYNWENTKKSDVQARIGTRPLWFKIRNEQQIVCIWYSFDGKRWIPSVMDKDVTDYNHNIWKDFQSLLPGVFAYGAGKVKISDFEFTVHEH